MKVIIYTQTLIYVEQSRALAGVTSRGWRQTRPTSDDVIDCLSMDRLSSLIFINGLTFSIFVHPPSATTDPRAMVAEAGRPGWGYNLCDCWRQRQMTAGRPAQLMINSVNARRWSTCPLQYIH